MRGEQRAELVGQVGEIRVNTSADKMLHSPDDWKKIGDYYVSNEEEKGTRVCLSGSSYAAS